MIFGISYNKKMDLFELRLETGIWHLTREAFFKMLESFIFVGQDVAETTRECAAVEKAREVVEKYVSQGQKNGA